MKEGPSRATVRPSLLAELQPDLTTAPGVGTTPNSRGAHGKPLWGLSPGCHLSPSLGLCTNVFPIQAEAR